MNNLPPGCLWPSDIDYYDAMNRPDPRDEEDEDTVPAWIGPHCPVCLDDLHDKDAVRCFSCGKRQHRVCAVTVGEDLYCRPECALHAALEALQDASGERDAYRAALIRTVALGDVSAAVEGLVATSGETALEQQLAASIEVVKQRKGEAA